MISSGLEWVLAFVLGLLALASVIALALPRLRPEGDHRELQLRVRTWWLIVLLFAAALWAGRGWTILLLAFISFLAFKEYVSMVPTRRADRRVLFWAYLAIAVQYALVWTEWYGVFLIFVPIYMMLLVPTRMILTGRPEGFLKAQGILAWGMLTTIYFLSHAAYLLVWPWSGTGVGETGYAAGAAMLVYLIFLTQFNDVAQYTWGKTLGRRKVVPGISPGKTWEGLLGGVLSTAVLAALLAPALTPFAPLAALLAGLLIGAAGFFGDVVMSATKRDLGIKDTSQMLPGHGGVLDRLDSLIFTAPLFFHLSVYLYG